MGFIDDAIRYQFDYTVNSVFTYKEWMRERRSVRSIGYIVDKGTREISADLNDLKFLGATLGRQAQEGRDAIAAELVRGNGISAQIREEIADLDDTVRRGLSELSDAVRQSADQIVSTLQWGFVELAGRLDQLNSSMGELIKIQRNKTFVWSDEQYRIAQDEARRGLYREALISVNRAINGFGGNTGLSTDFRFHLFQGIVFLGDLGSESVDYIDTSAAERSFLQAARCANTDNPSTAGQSLILAGRAAYLQNRLTDALAHTSAGLTILKSDATGSIQLARALFALQRYSEGVPHLVEALMIDPAASLEIAGIGDFTGNDTATKHTRTAIETATQRHMVRLKEEVDSLKSNINACSALAWDGITGRDVVSAELLDMERRGIDCLRRAEGAPLITVARMRRELKTVSGKLPGLFDKFKNTVKARISANIKRVETAKDERTRRADSIDYDVRNYYERKIKGWETILWVFFVCLGLIGCNLVFAAGSIGGGLISLFIIPIGLRIGWALLNAGDKASLSRESDEERTKIRELDTQISKCRTSLAGLENLKNPFQSPVETDDRSARELQNALRARYLEKTRNGIR